MNIRREPTYLSSDVWKACWLIARAQSTEADADRGGNMRTADEIAYTLLRTAIADKHPQVWEHLQAVTKLERELFKTL
jgi:hypothetical protein